MSATQIFPSASNNPAGSNQTRKLCVAFQHGNYMATEAVHERGLLNSLIRNENLISMPIAVGRNLINRMLRSIDTIFFFLSQFMLYNRVEFKSEQSWCNIDTTTTPATFVLPASHVSFELIDKW